MQIILSNGTASPLFTAKIQDTKNLQSLTIADYSVIKRVKGSVGGRVIHKLSFGKKDGSEITKVELSTYEVYGTDFVLADEEEIIGIFGTNNVTEYIDQLGFIVWKPPKI